MRITPACAGKTSLRYPPAVRNADHPRVCGENWGWQQHGCRRSGSPPRVRGKHAPRDDEPFMNRITPACAGKTHPFQNAETGGADHPRVCGENALLPPACRSVRGSPPRVRGKPAWPPSRAGNPRITPACAGKTALRTASCSRRADHPRVCGENFRAHLFPGHLHGSPPRVRGKPHCELQEPAGRRITPACAGKTVSSPSPCFVTADHPRVCGENDAFASSGEVVAGSPPRVRGKQNQIKRSRLAFRITPACAGKTKASFQEDGRRADHPRVCGENTSEMAYFRG